MMKETEQISSSSLLSPNHLETSHYTRFDMFLHNMMILGQEARHNVIGQIMWTYFRQNVTTSSVIYAVIDSLYDLLHVFQYAAVL